MGATTGPNRARPISSASWTLTSPKTRTTSPPIRRSIRRLGKIYCGTSNTSFIELKKFGKQEGELFHILDKWTYFIKNAKNLDVIPANVDDEGLKTAYLDADQQTWTKAERDAYDDFGIYLTGIAQRELLLQQESKQEGIKEGIKEGELKKEASMILAMHAAGLPVSRIATISGKLEHEVRKVIDGEIG
jgi:PD-(D/E)XK nuclease family transposase